MDTISALLIALICFIIMKSILEFITGGKVRFSMEMKESRFSIEIFYTLLVIYSIVIIGFGLIYFILSFHQVVLIEYEEYRDVSVLGTFIHSFYFSGVTLLTIGYGDITPVGIGRLVVLIQALIGYILPTAFVLRIVQTSNEGS
ncbi:ion channel [Virgibacillus sp. W0430]|uniref:ion channel n=1 Tax=Virgibacillus sp. W0430 TaxID=3391580 RepID=UPI003F45B61D